MQKLVNNNNQGGIWLNAIHSPCNYPKGQAYVMEEAWNKELYPHSVSSKMVVTIGEFRMKKDKKITYQAYINLYSQMFL